MYVQEKVVLDMGIVLLVENIIKIQKYYHSVCGRKRPAVNHQRQKELYVPGYQEILNYGIIRMNNFLYLVFEKIYR